MWVVRGAPKSTRRMARTGVARTIVRVIERRAGCSLLLAPCLISCSLRFPVFSYNGSKGNGDETRRFRTYNYLPPTTTPASTA